MATELLNQRIKDKQLSLKVHAKTCASVWEYLYMFIIQAHIFLCTQGENKRDVFKLRENSKAFDTTMRS